MKKIRFVFKFLIVVTMLALLFSSNTVMARETFNAPVECPGDCESLGSGYWQVTILADDNPTPYDRSYNVYIPAQYDKNESVPLLLHIHGYKDSAHAQHEKSMFSEQADENNFIIVYPEGYEESFNALECCGEAKDEGLDDIGLMLKIVNDITGKVSIDPDRIYASGHSNGAQIAHLLACRHSETFAAIATVSGNNTVANPDYYNENECDPVRKVPIISFMGIGYYNWGWYGDWYNYLKGINRDQYGCTVEMCDNRYNVGFKKDFEFWGEKNGCSEYITEENIGNDINKTHSAYRTTYIDCADNVEVSYYHLKADHVDVFDDAIEDGINIAEKAWNFLSKYSLSYSQQPPRVSIQDIHTDGNCILLSGSCTDASGISGVDVKIGNSDWLPASFDNNNNWSFDACDYADGTYSTSVKATDNEGLVTTVEGDDIVVNTQVECVTSSSKDHKDAGRAYYSWFRYYAKGSDDYLGTGSTVKSLIETEPNYWVKVDNCE